MLENRDAIQVANPHIRMPGNLEILLGMNGSSDSRFDFCTSWSMFQERGHVQIQDNLVPNAIST